MRTNVPPRAVAAPGANPPRLRPGIGAGLGFRALSSGAALAVIVLVVLPLLAILAQAVFPDLFGVPPSLRPSLDGLQGLASDPYMLASGINSLLIAAATAVLASAIGIAIACLLVLTDLPGRRLVWGLVWLILISPSFLLAQGWELLLAPGGLAQNLLSGELTNMLLSPAGVMLVLSLKLFPFSTVAVASGLEGLGQDVVHAARVSGASPAAAWRRVLLPLVMPAIVSGALIVFAEVLSDFGVASTLAQTANFPLTTFAIYSALEQFPVNFPEAAATSLVLVGAVVLAQWGQRAVTGRRTYATRWGGNRTLAAIPLRWARPIYLAVLLVFLAVAFGIPAATTAAASFMPGGPAGLAVGARLTLANYASALAIPYGAGSFATSLAYAVSAASIGLLVGLLVALAWRRSSGWITGILQGFLTTAIAVPGIVLGAGYIFLWDQPVLKHVGLLLYGTPAALLLAYVAGGLPYSVRVAAGGMAQIPTSAITAARVSGAGLGRVVRRIVLPMMRSTWVRIWLMLFAGVVFELPASQLLYPPGSPTLAVSIVHQFHNTEFGVGAALTVMSTAGIALLSLVFMRLAQGPSPNGQSRAVPVDDAAANGLPLIMRPIKGEEA